MDKYENEVWKPVAGFPRYEVSDLGRVRSIRIRKDVTGKKVKVRYVLKPNPRSMQADKRLMNYRPISPYLSVCLYGKGKKVTKYVHELVARAFLGNCPAGHNVDHINANKLDNRANNLRYLSARENTARVFVAKPCRKTLYKYKLEITALFDFSYTTYSVADLSARLEIPRSTIKHHLLRYGKFERDGVLITRERL